MVPLDTKETAGCWSGLRALLTFKRKRRQPNNTMQPSSPDLEPKIIYAGELPPEYSAPASDTRSRSKADQVSIPSALNVTHTLPSPEAADTSDLTIDDSSGLLRELSLKIHSERVYHF
ncbi:aminoacylase-like protein, putative, partial [Rhizoctonia solani AG-3 Rhs1AP]